MGGRGRLQRLVLLRGFVAVGEALDVVAEIVDGVLQIGYTVVNLWLPDIEIGFRRLHLRHGDLEAHKSPSSSDSTGPESARIAPPESSRAVGG